MVTTWLTIAWRCRCGCRATLTTGLLRLVGGEGKGSWIPLAACRGSEQSARARCQPDERAVLLLCCVHRGRRDRRANDATAEEAAAFAELAGGAVATSWAFRLCLWCLNPAVVFKCVRVLCCVTDAG
jgi:hypothetical protein